MVPVCVALGVAGRLEAKLGWEIPAGSDGFYGIGRRHGFGYRLTIERVH